MHGRFIVKKFIENICHRKYSFLMAIVVMTVTFYMLFDTLDIFLGLNYYIYEAKSVFATDTFLNVRLVSNLTDYTYSDKAADFICQLKEKYPDQFADFMYMNNVYYEVGEEEIEQKVLYINKNGLSLGKLQLIDESASDGCLKGYVCKEKLDVFPIGTVLENVNIGSKTKIVGYFDSGSEWMDTLLFPSTEPARLLNDYIVSEMDDNYFDMTSEFYMNMSNSLYILAENKEELNAMREQVQALAEQSGVMCIIDTLPEMIQREKEDKSEVIRATGILVLFVIAVAFTAMLTICYADVCSRHYETAVMCLNGVAPIDLYLMLLMENLVKGFISISIAICIYVKFGSVEKFFYRVSVPALIILGNLSIVLITTIAYQSIKQKKLLELIGGARL